MPRVTFDLDAVEPLMDHAEQSTDWNMGWGGDDLTPGPGLFLVGDDGVYLMSNGKPDLPRKDGELGSHVVYADGLDPNRDGDVWEKKRATFGGDDGAELLTIIPEAREWKRKNPVGARLEIEFTPTQLIIEFSAPRAPQNGRP